MKRLGSHYNLKLNAKSTIGFLSNISQHLEKKKCSVQEHGPGENLSPALFFRESAVLKS